MENLNIRIKYFEGADKIKTIEQGDWIDLAINENVIMKQGDIKLIKLGVAMELPKGYEANIVPRSSTGKKYGIIQLNHFGIVDNSYCGDNDQWLFPAYALRDTTITKGTRICQFRINRTMQNEFDIKFEETEILGNADRNGFGSTGE